MQLLLLCALFMSIPFSAFAAEAGGTLEASSLGLWALALFTIAYLFVIAEEVLHLRKSKPVVLAAGLIWILVAVAYHQQGQPAETGALLRHNMLEFAELMLFLLSAMTFINVLQERGLFLALRDKLVSGGFSLRALFWITGVIAFFMSPIADNLTTALVMGAVVLAVGGDNRAFVSASFINIVVAANAGGAFSPFGDITTLMVWQKGIVTFSEFFALFFPALVSWLIPAAAMHFFIPRVQPAPIAEMAQVKSGAYGIALLFLFTIVITVLGYQLLALPPFWGMMTGLGLLGVYGHFLRRGDKRQNRPPFDIFAHIRDVEWDTLLFFYGVVLCVGGLAAFGYLSKLSTWLYDGFGPTIANTAIGILSALIDNIPVMFAVLKMLPDMNLSQWLLVTLTAGIGGSLLSIGSAAGVALMGQSRGLYTFFSHLRWTPAIAAGYAAGILLHLYMNGA